MLEFARNCFATLLVSAGVVYNVLDLFNMPGATFVSLTKEGALRGCFGSLEPHRALLDDVTANAIAAATRDHRFPQLQSGELAITRIEVSLLSKSMTMPFTSEQDALEQLRPGIDGVVLQYGQRRGTFLPQVWESVPEPMDFLVALKQKAGIPTDFWNEDIQLSRYSVTKWKEMEPDHA